MSNLTVEQIARVFAMYWGCDATIDQDAMEKVAAHNEGRDYEPYPNKSSAKKIKMHGVFIESRKYTKLLLRPLSAITDEDLIQVGEIFPHAKPPESILRGDNDIELLYTENDGEEHPLYFDKRDGELYDRSGISNNQNLICQYLIQQGYAVPLFIAPGHPDNGKTAIELGLAIDSTLTYQKQQNG